MIINLSARAPFSFTSVVNSHGWARLAPFEFDQENGNLSYVFRLDTGKVVELQINENQDGVKVGIEGQLSEDEDAEIRQAVDWMLGLGQDFSEFYSLAKEEPKLQHVVNNAQGRLLRSPSLFEDVIKTILTTNTTWGGTIRMTEALVTQFGDRLSGHAERYSFPTAEAISNTDEDTLRGSTRLGYRSPFIHNIAVQVSAGNLDLEALKASDLPADELRKKLLSIKGIGNYAAANLLMLLGHYEYLAIDSWALKMVSHEWYDGEPVSAKEVETAFQDWGQWKGLAYWLWDWSYKTE